MSLSADNILDRMQLKKALVWWRNIAILALFFFLLSLVMKGCGGPKVSSDHVALVSIEGLIFEDQERIDALRQLRDDPSVKAIIVRIDSPGGTVVGGEALYNVIRDITKKKPVVAVLGSMAASGGYMTAVAASYIVAYQGTITGSIGVLLQTADITELAHKLGVNLVTLKTSELKGAPSPLEKMTPAVAQYMQENLQKINAMFIDMVAEGRQLPRADVVRLADGRIFMGNEALQLKLIDAIGDQETAMEWLKSNKKIDKNLTIQREDLHPHKTGLSKIFSLLAGEHNYLTQLWNGPIMAVWNPALLNH